jgi:hypothetical protein
VVLIMSELEVNSTEPGYFLMTLTEEFPVSRLIGVA